MSRRALPPAESPADLTRAQWLLRTAKAEAADAAWLSRDSRASASWSFVFCMVGLASSIVAVATVIGAAR